MNIILRQYTENDINEILSLWNQVISEGNSFYWNKPFSEVILNGVLKTQDDVICAVKDSRLVGFYILHANNRGRGRHIANALYAVVPDLRNQGIGSMLAIHSLDSAKSLGYKAIQFNSVISDNYASVRLWEKLGFEKNGVIKDGFKKDNDKFTDVYMYYKEL